MNGEEVMGRDRWGWRLVLRIASVMEPVVEERGKGWRGGKEGRRWDVSE